MDIEELLQNGMNIEWTMNCGFLFKFPNGFYFQSVCSSLDEAKRMLDSYFLSEKYKELFTIPHL